jgi:hypothetical protein
MKPMVMSLDHALVRARFELDRERTRAAYTEFTEGEKAPEWDELPVWLRYALQVAYMLGRRDAYRCGEP